MRSAQLNGSGVVGTDGAPAPSADEGGVEAGIGEGLPSAVGEGDVIPSAAGPSAAAQPVRAIITSTVIAPTTPRVLMG
ncbi:MULTISPECIES: hypothetical protein [unclassified Leifsonia]|uniref:hypothetical protein n=1 Tax=unclassified Leifsonia TaxID=2663824 RepID=UPI0012F7E3A2|nr:MULTISPECIES: hypothetical protein [unclassified Leifsonia]